MAGRWFEDFAVGDVVETRGVAVTNSQILDFALVYDPQPFHIDVEAAANGPFGGLIASGFQTLGLSFRLVLATGVFETHLRCHLSPARRRRPASSKPSARAREGTAGRLKNPARSTCPRTSTLRISHFPDPRNRRYNRPPARKTTEQRPSRPTG